MANDTTHLLAQYLRHLSSTANMQSLPDRELVERFARCRDEDAFTTLIRRHGPMVLRVCQRVLHDSHAAEDVFQATFLVLSRKAASLRCADTVGCWLHGVAYRLARNARKQRTRRQKHETKAALDRCTDDALAELSVREAQTILDEELSRLPEKYRAPLLLCCLQGRTRDEAARQLGWSANLVKSRLEQARERLRDRLLRRGMTVSAGLIAVLLSEEVVSASLPAALIRAAVQTMQACPGNAIAPSVAVLAEMSLGGTATVKAKIVMGLLLLTGVLAAGAGTFALREPAAQQSQTPSTAKPPQTPLIDKRDLPHLDCFGDPLPDGAVARLGTVRFRQGGQIFSLAFAPDGKMLASGGLDNAVRIWDVANGKELRRFTAAKGRLSDIAWVTSIAFSPDGKLLAAATGNGSSDVVIWETATGKEVRRFQNKRRHLSSIAFTPNGKAVAAGGVDRMICLYRIADGEVIHEFKGHEGAVEAIVISPDGKSLASAGRDKTVRLWGMATGNELRQLKGHTDVVQTMAFSHDGKKLASGSEDKTIRFWDAASGKELQVLKGHKTEVCSLAFFPDGKRLASCGSSWDSSIRFWDAETASELPRMSEPLRGLQGPVSLIAISPDGQTLAFDSWSQTVHVWDVAKGEERFSTKGSQGRLCHVAFSPDGKRIATGGIDPMVRLWDASSGNEVLRLIKPNDYIKQFTFQMQPGDLLRFAADGKMVILSQGYYLSRWRTDTGMQIQRREYGGVSLLPTPDGKFVVQLESQGDFCLLDAATGKKLRAFKAARSDYIASYTATISPDSKFLAVNSKLENGIIVIWELATGKERCRCKGAPHLANALVFSHDGKHLVGSTFATRTYQADNSIYLWDAATGRTVRQFRTPGHFVTCLEVSSDGRMLVSGGGDKTIRLWETATGKERQCFQGHQGIVRSVAVSWDGTRIVSASDDTTALVWDATVSTSAAKPTDKQLQAACNELASDDAAKAYRAMWMLARHPKQSVPLLREHLPSARPLDVESRKRIEQWLADLDSDEATVRDRASTELEKRVVIAEPMLRKALTGRPSLEQRKRIERVLECLERERVTLGRALEALEHAHAPEARRLLEMLAAGEPGAWLTQQAKAVLNRLLESVSNRR